MAVISCNGCGGKMNSELAVCPHCGVRRQLTERPKWSNDEIHALLATDQKIRDTEPRRGMFQTLVLPHPATSGGGRLAELALTVLSLPLVIAGAVTLGVSRRARHVTGASGELVPALSMTVFGGFGLLGHLPLAAIAVPIAALWTRALFRSRAGNARQRDLLRIEPPPRPSRPALPPARVVRDEPAGAAKLGPLAAAPVAATPERPERPEPPAVVAKPAAPPPAARPEPPAVVAKPTPPPAAQPEPPVAPGVEPRLLR